MTNGRKDEMMTLVARELSEKISRAVASAMASCCARSLIVLKAKTV